MSSARPRQGFLGLQPGSLFTLSSLQHLFLCYRFSNLAMSSARPRHGFIGLYPDPLFTLPHFNTHSYNKDSPNQCLLPDIGKELKASILVLSLFFPPFNTHSYAIDSPKSMSSARPQHGFIGLYPDPLFNLSSLQHSFLCYRFSKLHVLHQASARIYRPPTWVSLYSFLPSTLILML
jgi:hypothetical protein